MSLTFLAKSSAYSWKMSFDGQVLCQRMLIGPAGPGPRARRRAAAAVAPAASTNLRRVVSFDGSVFVLMMRIPPWVGFWARDFSRRIIDQ